MYYLYTFGLMVFLVISLPVLLWQYVFTPKYRGTLRERWGRLPCGGLDKVRSPCIWIHAVSVGEVMAAKGLVARLRQRHPKTRILLSTVTRTGREVAAMHLPHCNLFYFPLDFPWVVQRVVATLRPRLLVVMETELWPNLFRACGLWNIPILVVNGRLSPGSAQRYAWVAGAMSRILRPVWHFAMQTEEDAVRMMGLGVTPERITVTGNLKYDQPLPAPDSPLSQVPSERLGQTTDPIWLAASTHAGEEETILATYLNLRQNKPGLRLILAPRHPERAHRVASLIRRHNLEPLFFSQARGHWPRDEVLLVDEVGWLFNLYSMATVVFVGGSLVPHGGQNMLEPAAWGIPPIFGPHTHNFHQVVQQLLAAQAAVAIQDGKELAGAVLNLLQDHTLRQDMGQRGKQMIEENAGALDRTMDILHTCF